MLLQGANQPEALTAAECDRLRLIGLHGRHDLLKAVATISLEGCFTEGAAHSLSLSILAHKEADRAEMGEGLGSANGTIPWMPKICVSGPKAIWKIPWLGKARRNAC
jgi:hypothetical protein